MKLSDIESKQLLPRFAGNISWVMDALDRLIKETAQRVKSIDAPLTMESIEACTDAELEALYEQYGVAKYYPDLSRETRNKMLYEMCRIYRYLGTPHAIEVLCNYIFDGVQLNVKVFDNLAFDEDGTLVDESLLDVFDIEVNPTEPIFGADVNARILANIIRFSRNSQALRNIIYTFIQDFSISVSPCKRTGNPQVTQTWPQDSLCVPYTPPAPSYTEITLYMVSGTKYTQGGVRSTFTGNVTSSYCYQLYTDEECTIQWNGYDYSNDYVLGGYSVLDGEWVEYIDSVVEMPNDSSPTKIGYILMDFGRLWLCTNYTTSGYIGVNVTKIVVRIYPKEQQYYSLYGGASGSAYNNVSVINGGSRDLYGNPNKGSSSLIVPWGGSDASLPTVTLQAVLGSACNLVSGLSLLTSLSSFIIQNSSGASLSFRAVVFTLSKPTIISYTNTTNTVVTVNSSTPATLYDNSGNTIPYDASYSYIVLGAFNVSGQYYGTFGAAVTSSWTVILQVEFVGSQTLSINKIWYIKTPIT